MLEPLIEPGHSPQKQRRRRWEAPDHDSSNSNSGNNGNNGSTGNNGNSNSSNTSSNSREVVIVKIATIVKHNKKDTHSAQNPSARGHRNLSPNDPEYLYGTM